MMGRVGQQLPHPVTGAMFDSPVTLGTGWPGDPTTDPRTPLERLEARICRCRRCPRLVEWRERTAREKRPAYADQPYWGRPVPGWGSRQPRIVVVGLAPGAHGANRTGRNFTGDPAGDWLVASLCRSGLANQATSRYSGDGLELIDTRLIAPVRCAPPDNKPTVAERDTCAAWLDQELRIVSERLRVIVALGSFGWTSTLRAARRLGWEVPRPQPRFGHDVTADLLPGQATGGGVQLLGCYHPSRHNTATGRLTASMLDDVLGRAAALARS